MMMTMIYTSEQISNSKMIINCVMWTWAGEANSFENRFLSQQTEKMMDNGEYWDETVERVKKRWMNEFKLKSTCSFQ